MNPKVVNAIVKAENYHYITIFMCGEAEVGDTPVNTEPDKCEVN